MPKDFPKGCPDIAKIVAFGWPYNKWLQDNCIHNKKNRKFWAYEAALSCAQPKNAWKFDKQNDFTAFFHLESYYNLRLQFLLFILWS